MKTTLRNAEDVKKGGIYAKFNSGPHLCVDVPEGHFTITCLNKAGQKVTFAFLPEVDGSGHMCVDVQHHTSGKLIEGIPAQQVSVHGSGPLIHATSYKADPPATLTVVSLRKAI